MGFSREECWSGLLNPPPDLADPGIEPESLLSPALIGMFCTGSATWEAPIWGEKSLKSTVWEFPGSLGVRTPHLHCGGPGFILWSGN